MTEFTKEKLKEWLDIKPEERPVLDTARLVWELLNTKIALSVLESEIVVKLNESY